MLLWLLLVLLAVVAVFVSLRARRQPMAARVVSGDVVATEDGLTGRVVAVDGPCALVSISPELTCWILTSTLMQADHLAAADHLQAGDQSPPLALPSPSNQFGSGGLLERFAAAVFAKRRLTIGVWICVTIAALPLAGTAEKALEPGGFMVRGGDSQAVFDASHDTFGLPRSSLTVIVPGQLDDVVSTQDSIERDLEQVHFVQEVGVPRSSTSGEYAAFDISFTALDQEVVESVEDIRTLLGTVYDPKDVHLSGTPATSADTISQAKRDLAKAEMIGIPAALIVLLIVFRTGVAALVPLMIGIASVVVSLGAIHLLAIPLSLSVFVLNIATMLGLGLGIDYSLLGVSRFREELARGQPVKRAVITTVITAGRATAVSGAAVLCGIGALAVVPLGSMLSIAIGGAIVVFTTVIASITLLPALLGVIHHRIERFPLLRRRPTDPSRSVWYRLTSAVMRKPATAIAVGLLVLVALASPVTGAMLEVPHLEVLPEASPSKVADRLRQEQFGDQPSAPVMVEAQTSDQQQITELTTQITELQDVEAVKVGGVSPDTGTSLVMVTASQRAALGGTHARALVQQIEDLDTPNALRVGGVAAAEAEFLGAIRQGAPNVLILVLGSTLLVLGVAFRSIALPIKAVVLDALSIAAAFGVVLLVFQDGHGAGLIGVEPLGYADATLPLILFCILFGLSMDYEVFMLAKVTELYQAGHSDDDSVALGVAETAPLVTGAALVLIVLGISFALTELILVRQLGFGMAAALALDATIVRFVLLPATMKLLGHGNWWMPRALLRRIPRWEWVG